jgi:hypothetical protein
MRTEVSILKTTTKWLKGLSSASLDETVASVLKKLSLARLA